MHFSSLIVAAATLGQYAITANAAVLAPNPTCKKNACLAAVVSNRAHKNHSEWKPGCTSFFRKTITPRPFTRTVRTGTLQTTTKTVSVTDVGTVSITPVVTQTETIHETSTVTTVVVTAAAQLGRRLDERDDAAADDAEVDAARRCPTTKAGPSKLPSYAAACKNTVAYSSACSCVGVKRSKKTLRRCTTTKTLSRSGTVTATATTHIGGATTITVAPRTTTVTKTITDDVTATTTTTEGTTTITAAALGLIRLTLNSGDGDLVDAGVTETKIGTNGLGLLLRAALGNSPANLILGKDGHLTTDAGGIVALLANGLTLQTLPALGGLLPGFVQPTCTTGGGANKDELTCDAGDGKNKFAYCAGAGLDPLRGLSLVSTVPLLGGCKLVTVTVTDAPKQQ